ncbi:GGDEF domain-containing protein [Brucella sp. BE17]|uniref:GGDEF domain-containing protein n=1 Tax=Brucella sp. BE17 TaxID=3142977 RepID=UPI0031BA99EB
MTLVPFFLTANLTVAIVFVLIFTLVSMQEKDYHAPRSFAIASACAASAAFCSLWIPVASNPRLLVLLSFGLMLAVFLTVAIGLQQIYRQKIDWGLYGGFFLAALICNMLIYELPRTSLVHRLLYQLPLCFVHLLIIRVVVRSGAKRLTDKLLILLAALGFLHYFARAFLLGWPGSGVRPGDQIDNVNLVISLASGIFMQVTRGLLLLLITFSYMIGEVSEQSEVDELSRIYNRRGFDRHVSRVLARKGDRIHYSIIMSDLDFFKRINDTYGHDVGDRVIAAFGTLLKNQCPRAAILARMGGEEFVIFIPGMTLQAAHDLAQTLRQALSEVAFKDVAEDWALTASFGVAEQLDQQSLYETMRRADTALYSAKKSGRDCVHMA